MITPQPQPASYWIALLDELTDGCLFKLFTQIPYHYESLYGFVYENLDLSKIDNDLFESLMNNIDYIQSGKSVIDAAVEFNDRNTPTDAFDYIQLRDNLNEQVQLYKRCNGIKD